MNPKKKLYYFVLHSWILSSIVMVLVIFGMRYSTGLPRIVPKAELESANNYNAHLSVELDREEFRRELAPVLAGIETREGRVLAILEWVMTQVPKVENRYAKSSWQMIQIGRSGGGLICGGMAQVYKDTLLANGIPARMLTFQRNLFDLYDTHTSVEAWVDGKWRLYDPTFHITLKQGNERIGAFSARNWFIKGEGLPVEVEFLGEVRYPARVWKYPIRYQSFFNNIYVDIYRDIPLVSRTPIIGTWLSRELTYLDNEPGLSTMPQEFYRFIYYLILIALPGINFVLLIFLWVFWSKVRRSPQ